MVLTHAVPMQGLAQVPANVVERDYLAICIAEQIVRLWTVTDGPSAPLSAGARRALSKPLLELAESLGLREEVRELVASAIGGPV